MGYSPWWWQAARPFWLSKPVPCGCNRLWLCGESCPYKHAANSTAGNKRTELTFRMVWLFNPIKQLYSHKRLLIYKACATHTHQGIHSVQNLNRTTHTNPSKPSTKNMYTSCSHVGPKSPASVQKKKGEVIQIHLLISLTLLWSLGLSLLPSMGNGCPHAPQVGHGIVTLQQGASSSCSSHGIQQA